LTDKCEHIKTNGIRCGSPALRGEPFCYFHHRARRDFPRRPEPVPVVAAPALDIPFPEDADAIQYALGKVMYGLLNGMIDHKTAGLMLYALQTASGNLKNTSLYKRSMQADDADISNVSPTLAYYLDPSHEEVESLRRELEETKSSLEKLKQRLPSRDIASTAVAQPPSDPQERTNDRPQPLTIQAVAHAPESPDISQMAVDSGPRGPMARSPDGPLPIQCAARHRTRPGPIYNRESVNPS